MILNRSSRRYTYLALPLLICLCTASSLSAQISSDSSNIETYKEEAQYMVSFLEYAFNTLGDPNSTAQQKETIIKDSYLKVFRDAKVQVEDDLIDDRSTVTNKNVQAYLQDIDFFFKKVKFTFLVEEVSHEINEKGSLYFKVHYIRNLQGITNDGDSINSTKPRFIEINLQPEKRELKIVSMYTTKLSEQEDLKHWWNNMPFEWKKMFAKEVSLNDTIGMAKLLAQNSVVLIGDTLFYPKKSQGGKATQSLDVLNTRFEDTLVISSAQLFRDLKRIQQKEFLDLASNEKIRDASPLSKMTQLRELNISGTSISDLFPLRNLTRLQKLDIAFCNISDLSALKFAIDLQELNFHHTQISDLSPIRGFSQLKRLDCSFTKISDLQPLASLSQLKELNIQKNQIQTLEPLRNLDQLEQLRCANTQIADLSPLANKPKLQFLYVSKTGATDLTPLANATNLRLIHCDDTQVSSIEPLIGLKNLKKIYCDNTNIGRAEATRFMQRKPNCLVIFESSVLSDWWKNMPAAWQAYFREQQTMKSIPSREQLHTLANRTTVDISNRKDIQSLIPLQILVGLQELNCSNTSIASLEGLSESLDLQVLNCSHTKIDNLTPIQFLKSIRLLDVSHTPISSLAPLSNLIRLEQINCDHSKVMDLMPLKSLTSLRHLYCDQTKVTSTQVGQFLQSSPDCLVIFQTETLSQWWAQLGSAWQAVFRQHVKGLDNPAREQLHEICLLGALSIQDNNSIMDLTPLMTLLRLSHLQIENTRITDLQPLEQLTTLSHLTISRNPITDISPIQALKNLTYLNLASTPIDDLSALSNLVKIQELNLGGTQVKDLRPLETLIELRRIDVANTEVRKLKSLENLPKLVQLKCFNTRVSPKKINGFAEDHPNCEVIFY